MIKFSKYCARKEREKNKAFGKNIKITISNPLQNILEKTRIQAKLGKTQKCCYLLLHIF